MKITTTSGATYSISHGICKKHDANGEVIDVFKVYGIKPFTAPITIKEIHDLPDGEPQVGVCMYIWGKDVSWCTTPIVSIEGGQDEVTKNI